jgi:predicted DNA binding CopG/RHH family protein
MRKKTIEVPKFTNEDAEADWWVSKAGREFVKQKSAASVVNATEPRGSRLVAQLKRPASVQIALRLPEPDLVQARKIATEKGIGYQTLLKMLVHEGLRREARRS